MTRTSPSGPRCLPGAGRRLWWIPAGAAAVALSLVGAQLVVDARENAAIERLAADPGVFPLLDDELVVLRTIAEAEASNLWAGIGIGGARTAGLVVADDGSQSVEAVDQRTGEALWSTPLLGPDAERAAALGNSSAAGARAMPRATSRRRSPSAWSRTGSCATAPPGSRSGCPRPPARSWSSTRPTGTWSREWDADATAQLAVLDGLVVVGTNDAEHGTVVVAHDLRSGDVRWRYEQPAEAGAPGSTSPQFWGFFAAGDALGLYDGESLTVLSPTGTLVRDDLRFANSPGGGFGTDPVTGAFSVSAPAEGGGVDDPAGARRRPRRRRHGPWRAPAGHHR